MRGLPPRRFFIAAASSSASSESPTMAMRSRRSIARNQSSVPQLPVTSSLRMSVACALPSFAMSTGWPAISCEIRISLPRNCIVVVEGCMALLKLSSDSASIGSRVSTSTASFRRAALGSARTVSVSPFSSTCMRPAPERSNAGARSFSALRKVAASCTRADITCAASPSAFSSATPPTRPPCNCCTTARARAIASAQALRSASVAPRLAIASSMERRSLKSVSRPLVETPQ